MMVVLLLLPLWPGLYLACGVGKLLALWYGRLGLGTWSSMLLAIGDVFIYFLLQFRNALGRWTGAGLVQTSFYCAPVCRCWSQLFLPHSPNRAEEGIGLWISVNVGRCRFKPSSRSHGFCPIWSAVCRLGEDRMGRSIVYWVVWIHSKYVCACLCRSLGSMNSSFDDKWR